MKIPEVITKLDAARRQLDTAIKLWFQEQDTVPILTLAASSHQVIHDLNVRSGGEDLLFDNLNIKDEFRSQWIQIYKKPWNFFKHADKDPDGLIELDESLIVDYFLFSIKGLHQLGSAPMKVEFLFRFWLGIHRPEWLLSLEKFRALFDLDDKAENTFRAMSRAEFYNAHVDLLVTEKPCPPHFTSPAKPKPSCLRATTPVNRSP